MAQRLTLLLDHTSDLRDLLVDYGVEFPCGGRSGCGGCRIRVIEGGVPVDAETQAALSPAEIEAGWRLACRSRAGGRVILEIGQWQTSILTDESALQFEAAEGMGVVIDLGTTTLVAQAVDLATGEVRAVRSGLNPQASQGADVMTRIEFELREPGVLRNAIRRRLGEMVRDVLGGAAAREVLLAGNTVMHHLFCGISVQPLSHAPFHAADFGERCFSAAELGWEAEGQPRITFLPCIGGFVGSDITAGMIAMGMLERDEICALMDLGTNGEIVVGNRNGALCASTAAGPAFEAGKIGQGMRAASGAIDRVAVERGSLECHVIGGGPPRGICGSGLVDAVAAGLDTGAVRPSGRLANGAGFPLCGGIRLSQRDIRELQLAKGAVAAGFEMLAAGAIGRVHLSGAFGNYVDVDSARRIGLLRVATHQVVPAGNTALRGARLLLLNPSRREELLSNVIRRTRHVPLGDSAEFAERFAENLGFPEN